MTDLLPLPSRLKSAAFTLTLASASYDIWWFYTGEGTRDLDALNGLPAFFAYDEEAHFRNMIVALHTLYDDQPKTITIKSLIHGVEAETAKPIWRKYRAVHGAANKVACLRHNAIAHRNQAASVDDIFEKVGLRPDDLKKLISDSLALLVMVAEAIGVQEPMVSPFVTGQTARLVELAKAAWPLPETDPVDAETGPLQLDLTAR